jgi:hypothetical protein
MSFTIAITRNETTVNVAVSGTPSVEVVAAPANTVTIATAGVQGIQGPDRKSVV